MINVLHPEATKDDVKKKKKAKELKKQIQNKAKFVLPLSVELRKQDPAHQQGQSGRKTKLSL